GPLDNPHAYAESLTPLGPDDVYTPLDTEILYYTGWLVQNARADNPVPDISILMDRIRLMQRDCEVVMYEHVERVIETVRDVAYANSTDDKYRDLRTTLRRCHELIGAVHDIPGAMRLVP